jgi:FAD/FMN-containing dehydrogenase
MTDCGGRVLPDQARQADMATTIPQDLIAQFTSIVGAGNALTPESDLSRYTVENRGIYVGNTPLVLKPGNTGEVARIMALASETRTAIVPQGGHTGHAAGAVPDESGTQIVVSMERMNKVRDFDLIGNTAIVEAGYTLQDLQELADRNDRLFPLSLASQGTCQIGGNIATNAGGTGVLSYGNTRDLILGLEVVTPSGEIWDGLRRLKKDNTGYDLRDLFIGSEGTLGIVTAAVVRLFPKPKGRIAAYAGMASAEAALELLSSAIATAGKSLTGFELMPRIGMDAVFSNFPGQRDPLSARHEWYVLMEISSGISEKEALGLAVTILNDAMEKGIMDDAVVAQNERQRAAFWSIRETMPASQKFLGGSIKNDISVPVHLVPDFLTRAGRSVREVMPDARIFGFGHLGDGNLHYNISQPESMSTEDFLGRREELNDVVNRVVIEMGGSISAEHGIGRLKRDLLARTKSPVELAMMRAIKKALDPRGIMNPGKVL